MRKREDSGFAGGWGLVLDGAVRNPVCRGFFGWLLLCAQAAGDPARLEFARGVLAECRGEAAAAEAAFEKAWRLDPQAGPLVRRVVAARLDAGDRGEAVRLMREWAEGRPDEAAVQVEYADFLTEVGRGDALARRQAIGVLEGVLAVREGSPQVVRRLFALWREDGKEERARAVLESLDPNDAEAALVYGPLAASAAAGDDAEAMGRIVERYRRAMAREPEHAALARAASEFLRGQGRLDEAVWVLASHAEAAPWSLELRTRLGILHLAAGDDDAGQRVLEAVLAISPRRVLAHQSLAKLHRLRGRAAEARHHAAELLKIRGGSAAEYLALADEYLAEEEVRAARLLLENAAFAHPRSAAVRMRLAVASRRDPETRDAAAGRFREATLLMSGDEEPDPAFLMESAEVLIADGQVKAAEESLRTAIRSYPPEAKRETAAALRRLAALWEGENRNVDAARGLRQRAQALDPEGE